MAGIDTRSTHANMVELYNCRVVATACANGVLWSVQNNIIMSVVLLYVYYFVCSTHSLTLTGTCALHTHLLT